MRRRRVGIVAVSLDVTEVDANADVAGITVRLAAALFLAFCSGVAARPRPLRRA